MNTSKFLIKYLNVFLDDILTTLLCVFCKNWQREHRIKRDKKCVENALFQKSFPLVIPDLIRDPDFSSGLVEELKQFPRIPEFNWLRRRSKDL